MHHADRGPAAGGAFHIDDLVALAHAQIDALADPLVQPLHQRQRGITDVDPRLDQVAQFEQADAQAVGAGVRSFHDAADRHGGQDAMGRGRMQPGFQRELLQADRVVVTGEHVEEGRHPLDDLDAAARLGGRRSGGGKRRREGTGHGGTRRRGRERSL